MKFETARIHFLGDVFAAVAIVTAQTPYYQTSAPRISAHLPISAHLLAVMLDKRLGDDYSRRCINPDA